MNHANKNLYQIGEVTKMLGVTRRMLLNYEDLGLLTPAYKMRAVVSATTLPITSYIYES